MSKSKKIVLSAAFAVVIAAFIWIFLYIIGNSLPEKDKYVSQHLIYSASYVDKICISEQARDVYLVSSADSSIHVYCFDGERSSYDVQLYEGVLTVEYNGGGYSFFNKLGMKVYPENEQLMVAIPQQAYTSILVECVRGDVMVRGIAGAEKVDITTDSGNVFVDEFECSGELSVKTNTGDSALNLVDAGTYSLITEEGTVSAEIIGFSDGFFVEKYTELGSIVCPECSGSRRIYAETGRGSIHIEFNSD